MSDRDALRRELLQKMERDEEMERLDREGFLPPLVREAWMKGTLDKLDHIQEDELNVYVRGTLQEDRADDLRRLAAGWGKQASAGTNPLADSGASVAEVLALAYPDRVAKARGPAGQFLLANGRAGVLDVTHPLSRAPYLVVAELQGKAAATRIILAVAADDADVLAFAGSRIVEADDVEFDASSMSVRARRTRRLGAIVLSSDARALAPGEDVSGLLAEGIARGGVARLAWSKAQMHVRERVAFLRQVDAGWPDLSDETLSANATEWLAPFLTGKTRISDISADDLGAALDTLLPWNLRQRLDAEAPTHFEAPTGNRHPVDYEGPGAPSLSIRVQELYGLKVHPAIASGKLPLTLNLLSPAHRPIQITRDLPGFWAGSWAAVRADLRGQYPKHLWPEDPANAAATARAKPRGT